MPAGDEIAAALHDGDRRALARLLTEVERGAEQGAQVLARLGAPDATTALVGITGAPGAGKSTLVEGLLDEVRAAGDRVAVLAIDPSSPYSGGAILGDRVRMQAHATDPGVYIRSMATRGHLGGLALATPQAAQVLAVAGFEWVIIETVGVGQVEIEIASHADTTVVVVNPGWGDGVQAAKAGLLEIADVFVVNKSDRPGATETVRDLEGALELAGDRPWRPPVVQTVATSGEGCAAVLDAIRRHRAHLDTSGEGGRRRRERVADEIRRIAVARLERAVAHQGDERFDALVDDVLAGRIDAWTAAGALLG